MGRDMSVVICNKSVGAFGKKESDYICIMPHHCMVQCGSSTPIYSIYSVIGFQ